MEDPITFDIWGIVVPDRKPDATAFLERMRPTLDRMGVLKAIVESASSGRSILVAEQLGWDAALAAKREVERALTDVRIFQAGFGPQQLRVLAECGVHGVYYAGVLGCHVCGGRAAR